MTKIKDIIQVLEAIAPPAYQESYDNSGLIVGDPNQEVSSVLLTLDCIESVVEEAMSKGANLIIAHHPIVFQGLKKLNGKNYVERTVLKAIKNDIAIYAIHTNLDNVHTGVNAKIAEKLSLTDCNILSPKTGQLSKLETFIPIDSTDTVLAAIHKAGAGNIGDYSNCSFRILGTGSFKSSDSAKPAIGTPGQQEQVEENKVEVIFSSYLQGKVVSALQAAHPYEEAAYYIHSLANKNQEIGSGMVGHLEKPMTESEFLTHLKSSMDLKTIKYTPIGDQKIKKVAVCGGSGSFLLGKAKSAGADAFVTSDFKYHEFFDSEGKVLIADIGHYESEVFTKDLLAEFMTENFANIATYLSEVDTNPVKYF